MILTLTMMIRSTTEEICERTCSGTARGGGGDERFYYERANEESF